MVEHVGELGPFGDELVLIVMGPGSGGSVLVRWPPDHWLVVDSFHRSGRHGGHPALEALTVFNARPDAVALTHPHSDHTGGFVELVERCLPEGRVGWWPPGERLGKWDTPNAGLATRQGNNENAVAAIDAAWKNHPACRWELRGGHPPLSIGGATITVLAPLQATVDHNRNLANPRYNEMSSAMLVEWEGCRLLLGADLVNSRGWEALHAAHGALAFSQGVGMKISHHGSFEAQHSIALGDPPPTDRVYFATPFDMGRGVPDFRAGGDVDNLLTVMHRLHLTTHHGALPADNAVAETARAALEPEIETVNGLEVELDATDRAPIDECWLAARWDPKGKLIGIYRGAGSVVVTA